MGTGVPFVHRIQQNVWLMHRNHRPLGDNVEVTVGDDRRDFNNDILLWLKTCHLQVHPDQIIFLTHVAFSVSMLVISV